MAIYGRKMKRRSYYALSTNQCPWGCDLPGLIACGDNCSPSVPLSLSVVVDSGRATYARYFPLQESGTRTTVFDNAAHHVSAGELLH